MMPAGRRFVFVGGAILDTTEVVCVVPRIQGQPAEDPKACAVLLRTGERVWIDISTEEAWEHIFGGNPEEDYEKWIP